MATKERNQRMEPFVSSDSGNKSIDGKNYMDKRFYDQPVLEALCFPENNSKANISIPLLCLLCDKMFEDGGVKKSDALLHHLLVEHQFVIADVDLIADFKSYINYWKRRFQESPLTDICSVININSRAEDVGPKLQYNLLCDGLPEDKELREQLQIKKLQGILHHQQQERTDSHFSRICLFCNVNFEGNRSQLFQHMVDNHAFNVGLPDNLVYVNEFLDKLEEKLNNLQCLFCEKTFKDRPTLRDHMRKKQHRKINPKNKEFDKYYLINYLEVGKNWHDILDEDDTEINQKSKDENWDDWQEEDIPIHCLFCKVTSPTIQEILNHMKKCHGFDLLKTKKNQGLNFYEEVKIVNYVRRQVYNSKCIFCKERFTSNEVLLDHLNKMCHFELPDRSMSWDQPEYFFPTFENDGLLCGLPDDDDDDYCEDTVCDNLSNGKNRGNSESGNEDTVIGNDVDGRYVDDENCLEKSDTGSNVDGENNRENNEHGGNVASESCNQRDDNRSNVDSENDGENNENANDVNGCNTTGDNDDENKDNSSRANVDSVDGNIIRNNDNENMDGTDVCEINHHHSDSKDTKANDDNSIGGNDNSCGDIESYGISDKTPENNDMGKNNSSNENKDSVRDIIGNSRLDDLQ
ncbi:zinc finger protein 277-like [Dendronephthya gigantea]|uniref:zinc finger protein 277-like n=1 Tax=Dendronephthya gigantea TaxID=151771 RepID=UPI00106D7DB2|nr:zinc finger protein 277-like [Dendronephthya gigantea]